jgi:Outer membrane protein beta-barrel family/Carboxypeptidase regulatory-like domain
MKKQLLLLLTCCCFTTLLMAQNNVPAFINMKGKVVDTANTTLPMATIMLLSTVDNKLMYFTHTDNDGAFSFSNIKNNSYVLKVNYLSFYPFQKMLQPTMLKTNDIGVIKIKPIAQVLTEVVIKAARAPITFHGDTIEYNAASFKVPPGSTVEDLLKRLPGIDVDIEGNVSAQGQNVNKVYVNGNRFFSDNPKIATKNLGAEMISNVQVYNEKSLQEKLTGIKDGNKEKVINLNLKKEYKNSGFGKVTGGAGSSDRWLTSGSYFKFNDKRQISFIGYGNNVNQQGAMGSDLSDFMGKNKDAEEDYTFGFNPVGTMLYGKGNPFYNSDSRGFTKNYGGGTNYNFFNKKTKFYTNYIYTQTNQQLDQYSNRKTFLNESTSYNNADTSFAKTIMKAHNIASDYQYDIDSLNKIMVKANINYRTKEIQSLLNQLYTSPQNTPLYHLNTGKLSKMDSWNVLSSMLYSHRFKKEGQSFLFSAGYSNSKTDNSETVQTLNSFFNATTFTEQINRLNTTDVILSEVKTSLLYTQLIVKNCYFQTFYNFNYQISTTDKVVGNALQANSRIDSLSSYFQYINIFNRLGSAIRFSVSKLSVNIGMAGQSLLLSGNQSLNGNMDQHTVFNNKNYYNIIPYVGSDYRFSNKAWFSFKYITGITPPKITDLSPVPLSDNSLFVFYGDPFLKPEKANIFNADFVQLYPSKFIQFTMSAAYTNYINQIVYNQTILKVEGTGYKTITRPFNVSGGNSASGQMQIILPLLKSKLRTTFRIIYTKGSSSAYINDLLNKTKNSNISGNIGFSSNITDKITLNIRQDVSYSYLNYSINHEQNQYFTNNTLSVIGNWQMAKKLFFESSMRYSNYRNKHYNINVETPIWNASLRTIVGKSNRIEIRLAAFDILNRTINFTQRGTLNYFQTQYTPTLTRYFMLSVSYNIKGFTLK